MNGWMLAPGTEPEDLGFLPSMLSEEDPHTAQEQLDANYPWGGYWRTEERVTIDDKYRLCYPGDPPLNWVAFTVLHGTEVVLLYPADLVAILQPDGTFKFQRMD